MLRIAIALALSAAISPAALAASFDCSKATTSFEGAICASPELSKRDEVLATAYATALGGLSVEAAAKVKATQHGWLDYAARVCSADANPIEANYNDDQTLCLMSTFRSRIAALEASRMIGDFRFYPVEWYLVEPDTEAAEGDFNKVADKHFQSIRIDGTDEVAAAFNAMTEKMRQTYTDLFPKGSGEIAAGDVTEDIDVTTTVASASDFRITLTTNEYSYGHGAAHGNYAIWHDHFLVAEKRRLVASDIFAAKNWQKALGRLVVAKLKAQLGDAYFPDSEADIPDWAAEPGRWDFSYDGLIVQFQPYDVASYADGAVTVTVPWNDIRDLLAEHAEEIATY